MLKLQVPGLDREECAPSGQYLVVHRRLDMMVMPRQLLISPLLLPLCVTCCKSMVMHRIGKDKACRRSLVGSGRGRIERKQVEEKRTVPTDDHYS